MVEIISTEEAKLRIQNFNKMNVKYILIILVMIIIIILLYSMLNNNINENFNNNDMISEQKMFKQMNDKKQQNYVNLSNEAQKKIFNTWVKINKI